MSPEMVIPAARRRFSTRRSAMWDLAFHPHSQPCGLTIGASATPYRGRVRGSLTLRALGLLRQPTVPCRHWLWWLNCFNFRTRALPHRALRRSGLSLDARATRLRVDCLRRHERAAVSSALTTDARCTVTGHFYVIFSPLLHPLWRKPTWPALRPAQPSQRAHGRRRVAFCR